MRCLPRLSCPPHLNYPQEELNLSKDLFRERYGETPRKEDLTILVPRQDDPTEQVCVTGYSMGRWVVSVRVCM